MLIELFMSDDFLHREFTFWIFKSTSETVVKDGVESVVVSGLGIFLASTFSNILAQIVSFFINKDKTFNSSKKTSTTLPIYIVFTIALICFSAWLTPTFTGFLMTKGLGVEAASGISGALCGMIQFFLYFPVDKILFSEKKEKKAK
jgi:putative flippase GtrA